MKKNFLTGYFPLRQPITFLFRSLLIFAFLFSVNSAKAQQGGALEFDGVDDYVQLPGTLVLHGSYTKEAWINVNNLSTFNNILSGTATAIFAFNGTLSAGNESPWNAVVDPTPLTINTWYHIAVTYDSATQTMRLYKDGIKVDSATGVTNTYAETPLVVGAFGNGNFGFSGSISEIRIWSVARTEAEIAASEKCALTGDEPNLLAYYSCNQGIVNAINNLPQDSVLLDSSDKCTNYTGQLVNFALTGPTSNWVAPSDSLTGGCTNTFSNINVTGNNNCIIIGENNPSTNDSTDFGTYGTTPITTVYTISNTGGADLNITSINITGTNASDFTIATMPSSTIAAGTSSNLVITFSPTGSLGSKSAIVTINNNDGDEGVFTFAIQGLYAGKGQALAFDGFSNYVSLPVGLSGSYTKEAWINTGFLGGFPNILTGTGTALFLNNGQLAAGHTPTFGQLLDTTTTNPIAINTWYHVAVTYDSINNEMKLYRDGILVADSVGVPTYTEPSLNIGTFGGSSFWFGQIDEVRLWNVARTQGQIAASMNCQLTGDEPGLIAYYNFNEGINGVANPGLTTLYDSSDKCTAYNGTLQNFTLDGTTSNWVAPGGNITGGCTNTYPNINVTGNAVCITDGNTVTSSSDNTDFGTISTSLPISKTFSIQNTGSTTLNIDSAHISGTDSTDYTVTVPPASTVAPGGSTSITIKFLSQGVGQRNAVVNIYNDDPDEAPFVFNITGNATVILPVTLQSFNGAANGTIIQLNWKIATTLNSKGFEVWRSANGIDNWVKVGYVATTGASQYGFTDASPLQGTNVYQLKEIDVNGNYKFSQQVSLNLASKGSAITLYPNPVKNKLTLVLNDNRLLNTMVQLNSIDGKAISKFNLFSNHQDIDMSNVPRGVYVLSFNNGEVKKVIKQ